MSAASSSGPVQLSVWTSSISSEDASVTLRRLLGDQRLGFFQLPPQLVFSGRRVVMASEVGIDHCRVGTDRVGGTLGDDTAFGEHDDPVAHVVDDVHVVL